MQVGPENPVGQIQENIVEDKETHLPPFAQGVPKHIEAPNCLFFKCLLWSESAHSIIHALHIRIKIWLKKNIFVFFIY